MKAEREELHRIELSIPSDFSEAIVSKADRAEIRQHLQTKADKDQVKRLQSEIADLKRSIREITANKI